MVGHAVAAADECIGKSGVKMADVGLLINVGIYRDDNLAEPSMAALIQQRLVLNIDPTKNETGSSTFSFDLMNGACGFLYAVQIVDSCIKNGIIRYGMIVSGDTHPSQENVEDFPFSHVASAMLLERTDQVGKGFLDFYFKTSPDMDGGLQSFVDVPASFPNSKRHVTVKVEDDFIAKMQEFSIGHVRALREDGCISAPVKVVASHPVPGFGANIARSLGQGGGTAIDLFDRYGDSHTSALPLAYHVGRAEGVLRENDRILFAGAGAGLTSACALYVV